MGTVYKAKAKLGGIRPLKYKIFYANGQTYCDEDGPVNEAPKAGVMMVVVEDAEVGRVIEQGGPYWVYDGFRWTNVNEAGLHMYMFSPGWKLVLYAQAVPDNHYRNFLAVATSDTYLPPKTAETESESDRFRD